jgi:hypothetical protein
MLRSNRHYNDKLQKDWLQLGGDCFTIFPVELVEDTSFLLAREKAWIEKCRAEGGVYNIANSVSEEHRQAYQSREGVPIETDGAKSRGKKYCFISPIGTQVKVRGMRALCEAYNLNISHMSKVHRGILVQHKGWTRCDCEAHV